MVRPMGDLGVGANASARVDCYPEALLADVPAALDEMRAGRMLVVVDDEDRENEGDVILAAEKVSADAINFMATHARGLICLSLTEERADHLRLPVMVRRNTESRGLPSPKALTPGRALRPESRPTTAPILSGLRSLRKLP